MTMQIQGLAAFLDDLMGGLILIGLSVVIGAIAWGAVVLRGGTQGRELLQRCLALMRTGAGGCASREDHRQGRRRGSLAR